MGDSKDSFTTRAELNESKMQSTSTPDLLENSMTSKDSMVAFRADAARSSSSTDKYLPATELSYDASTKQSHKSAQQFGSAASDKDLYKFDGSPIVDKDLYKFDGASIYKDDYKFDGMNVPGEHSQKDAAPKKTYIQHHEKSGSLDLTIDARGAVFGLKDKHHTFRKFGDEWFEDIDGGKTSTKIGKVEVNKQDGSYSFTNEIGKYSYDSKGQLVEAPAGDGHTRKFHYDAKGQVDQIDGLLGHWDRQVINGKVSWKNSNGVVWNGDFKVTEEGLEFRGDNGVAWGFTAQGKDLRLPATEK